MQSDHSYKAETPASDSLRDRPFSLESPNTVPLSPLQRAWRICRSIFVFCLVAFHLFYFVTRNILDISYKETLNWLEENEYPDGWISAYKRLDRFTYHFGNRVGCEQDWYMFSPPMAREAPFILYRLVFTNGETLDISTPTEPDPDWYFRLGGWQIRKFEEYLIRRKGMEKGPGTDPEHVIWEGRARYIIRNWRAHNPDDPRQVQRLVLLRRIQYFIDWEEGPEDRKSPTEEVIVRFGPDGRFLP